jgi:hypothetical protein
MNALPMRLQRKEGDRFVAHIHRKEGVKGDIRTWHRETANRTQNLEWEGNGISVRKGNAEAHVAS